MNHVLFICSGNYYRSRFAEAVFNHAAEGRRLRWRAFSRGLATHLVDGIGELCIYTRTALEERGIPLHHTGNRPTPLARADLERADRVIAIKEDEHRAMMRAQFPDWEDRIEYWHVHDLDMALPEEAIPELERRVLVVLDEILRPAASSRRG